MADNVTDLDGLLAAAYEMTDRPPLAKAMAGPPVGDRRMWLVVVPECPICSSMHAHRAIAEDILFSGDAIRDCPVTGEPYALFVTQRMRKAAA